MNRQLLSDILSEMKKNLKESKGIGDLKAGALFALGQQLDAIFYYLGHELGNIINVKPTENENEITEQLMGIISEYHLGEVEIVQSSDEIIELRLRRHSSIKDLINKGIQSESNFCSFEAGILAGIVEKMSDFHCFAQEVSCSLQSGNDFCEFMIVFQKE
ncbi:MAG: V4R domain protein [Promethearchaeota archaeon]|nr:MAG: V4R domain protein [Candidatus Lokiarchaeota archaeon]